MTGIAQANPLAPPAAVQPVMAQEQPNLISTNPQTPGENSTPMFVPGSIPLATAPQPVQQYSPLQQPAASLPSSEDELIQQVSGKAVARSAKSAPVALPVFAPLTGSVAPAQAPVMPAPVQTAPVLVTTGSNSDVSFGLLPNSTCLDSQRCHGMPPSASFSDLPVPSVPRVGQSTPLPPPPALSPAEPASGAVPGSSLGIPPEAASPQIPVPGSGVDTTPAPRSKPLLRSTALGSPSLRLQGVYLYQGDESSARGRLSIDYPLTPNLLFGATFDITDGNAFADSRDQGFSVNELYFAASVPNLPNLRFVVGQLDLTSYFDRNSFAKDGATHFFNTVFQTNPALAATGIASRQAALINWSLTDNIEAKAAVFSSANSITDFALNGFAGEVGIRYGNLIVRGTYVTDRDSGQRDGFQESYQVARNASGTITGVQPGDREEAYGVNAELFIPSLKMGVFGRYGHYNDLTMGLGGDTYSAGISFLDLFAKNDRLGLAYGRNLSNVRLQRQSGEKVPDVLELFYDFRLLPNLSLAFMLQERNNFSETIAGVRVRTEFDAIPIGRLQ